MAPESKKDGETFDQFRNNKIQMISASFVVGAAFHPMHYAKVLMQLGHEPLALERGKSFVFFGREATCLPNILKYIRHIKRQEGFFGLYRGLGARLCHDILGVGANMAAQHYLDDISPDPVLSEFEQKKETHGEAYARFLKSTLKQSCAKSFGVIVSRPFEVIMIRNMAQFVGGETLYVGVFSSFGKIKKDEGWGGLFAGLASQLVGELMIYWTTSTILFAVERAFHSFVEKPVDESEEEEEVDEEVAHSLETVKRSKNLVSMVVKYVVPMVLYPFQVVSVVMAVNGTSLRIASEIPNFNHWQDCWDFLSFGHNLKRGGKSFMRWYDGPVVSIKGLAYVKGAQ